MKTAERFPLIRPCAIAGLLIASILMTSIHAQERAQLLSESATDFNFGWATGVNAEYSDNILRAENDKAEETSIAAFLRMDLGARRARWAMEVDSDLQYRTYLDQTLDDELNGAFSGRGELRLLGDALTLRVEDRYGQTRIDYTEPSTPENRESINELTAGAELNVPLGKRLTFFAADDWSIISYKESDIDSERNEISGGLQQQLTARSAVFVTARRSQVKFKTTQTTQVVTTFDDYGIDEALLGFSASSPKTGLVLSGGKTRVRGFEDFPEQTLIRASIVRRLGARVEARVEGGTEYTDATQTFVREQQVFGVIGGLPGITISPDPFKSDYATVGMAYDGSRYGFDISVSGRRERHELNPALDAEFIFGQMGLSRRFSERADVYLRASYDRNEGLANTVAGPQVSLYDTSVRLGANLRPWRNVVVETYVVNNSGQGLGTAAGNVPFRYRENVIGLSIGFSPPRR